MVGRMDGTWLKFLKKEGVAHATSISIDRISSQVYWLDSSRKRMEHTRFSGDGHQSFQSSKYAGFTPKRLVICSDRLYWVGTAGNGSSEEIFSMDLGSDGPAKTFVLENVEHIVVGNLNHVTGLAMQDESQLQIAKNPCGEGDQCAGVCLLSGNESFQCVCPLGLELDSSGGSFCQGWVFYVVHYCRRIWNLAATVINFCPDSHSQNRRNRL